MKMLEDRIRKDGIVREGNVLKVDSFINHQMDIPLFREMAKEWKHLFDGKPINKVLTIEASGIGIAAVVALSLIHIFRGHGPDAGRPRRPDRYDGPDPRHSPLAQPAGPHQGASSLGRADQHQGLPL